VDIVILRRRVLSLLASHLYCFLQTAPSGKVKTRPGSDSIIIGLAFTHREINRHQASVGVAFYISPLSDKPLKPPQRAESHWCETKLHGALPTRLHAVSAAIIAALLPVRARLAAAGGSIAGLFRASLAGLGADAAARVAAFQASGASSRAAGHGGRDRDARRGAVDNLAVGIRGAEDGGARAYASAVEVSGGGHHGGSRHDHRPQAESRVSESSHVVSGKCGDEVGFSRM